MPPAPTSPADAPATPASGRRFTVGRRLAVLAALGAASTLVVGGVTLVGVAQVEKDTQRVQSLTDARKLLLRLDTRSSELKVDAYKAAVRPDPAEQHSEVTEDTATAQGFLDELTALPLDGELATQVKALPQTYAGYVAGISAYVDLAVQDQVKARETYEDIAKANSALDDVLGAAIDTATADSTTRAEQLSASLSRVKTLTVTTALLALAALGVLALMLTRGLVRPIARVRQVLGQLAAGDLTGRTGVTSNDEVGDMARALDAAQTALGEVLSSMAGSATSLAAASEEMSATAGAIATSAQETSAQSEVVSAAAEQVSRNVQTVATGAAEMGASIDEIAQNAHEAARVGASAVGVAESTNATVSRLGDSSREIGDVVKIITRIAEQTNLLALNATIEAARAGESGKGFAVVANEVKELAQETAKATEDIGRRVEAIQADTAGAVVAIAEISSVIARMNDFQNTIASAVEEQTATTGEMTRSVSEAATGTSQIAENIVGVASAAQTTSTGVQDTQNAANELARMSNELQTLVGRFRY